MKTGGMIAQVVPIDTPAISPALWDFLLVGGIITGLTVIIFVVALVGRSRRSKRRKKRGPAILRNSEEYLRDAASEPPPEPPSGKVRKKKRRHKHHKHRRELPTLADSGGLPPVRDKDCPPNSGL